MYYSPSKRAFFIDPPFDGVEITPANHSELLAGVYSGKVIEVIDGRPILVEAPPSLPTAPTTITMRQARLCLHKHGLLSGVQPAIDALPEPDKTAAQIEWDYSATVERDRGFVQQVAQALGLSNQQLDELFIEAATL